MDQELKLFSKKWAMLMTQEVHDSKQNWDYLIEIYSHKARLDKLTFDSYIKEGFTEEQALYLTKD